jgi:hypothetical protein
MMFDKEEIVVNGSGQEMSQSKEAKELIYSSDSDGVLPEDIILS